MSIAALDAVVAKYDLNQHPFYRAWRAGTLPRPALASYADQYAPFIASVADGWATLGNASHAAEERRHAELWDEFREALAGDRQEPCAEARALREEVSGHFGSEAGAIGALYAFEAQQPSTARSKLEGLREHYALEGDAVRYFALHADEYGERDMLGTRAAALTADDLAIAEQACERTCRAMWDALTGILAPHAAGMCA
jgi:pyrroloquinoline-quinone synthase